MGRRPPTKKAVPEALRYPAVGESLPNSSRTADRTYAERLREILQQVLPHMSRESIEKTPQRFLDYLQEFNQAFIVDDVLGNLFEGPIAEDIHGMVVQANIPFRMACEHHLLPATGRAFLGYIPNGKVVGLSKLARLVDAVSTSRPWMQEMICETIVDTLHEYTRAKGVICVIDSEHTCMACRGVNVPGVQTTTSCVRGIFRDVPGARSEFFSIIASSRRGTVL